ncbi:MAG TPA: triose-phosphate isomerase [Steroidobacteraceae bacterium]|jgi:triosephosphate isomerase|nr:triose-phosphate isomerase [Steroidobacteraceae bacterium]
MRLPIVAGNWKMHGSRSETARLIEELLAQCPPTPVAACVVCPPFVYLQEAGRLLRDSQFSLGAQDVCADAQGAFTGEVSAAMLKDVGCEYVIVGHSERRLLYRESDQLIARKFGAAYGKGLVPILCVGEQLAEREAGRTREVVARQLDAVLELCGAGALEQGVIAYEPVWAIGTGRNASPEQAQEVHAFIRARIGARDARIAAATRILYGGSVKAGNAAELFAMPDVDGGLIGGASLKADEFLAILAAARIQEE